MKNTNQNKELILEQLRKVPIVELGCQKVGVSRMTLYRWKKDDAAFAKAVDEALLEGRLFVSELAEHQLISAIKDRNLPAVTYWLKHHHPNYKTKIEIEGAISAVYELSPEQEALMRKAFLLAGINFNEYGTGTQSIPAAKQQ
jgi:hypothetical protein